MKKKFTYIVIILNIAFFKANAQNLVPNGSFELYKKLPTQVSISTNILDQYLFNWSSPSYATPDYFNANSTVKDAIIPNLVVLRPFSKGFVNIHIVPISGIGITGIVNLYQYKHQICSSCTPEYYTEYIRNKLYKPLTKNVKYTGSFYCFIGDTPSLIINKLGMLISENENLVYTNIDTVYVQNYFADSNKPQITNDEYLKKLNVWKQISGSFKAKGGEEFVTLGYFKQSDANEILDFTQIKFYNDSMTSFSNYIYIDSVSLYEIKGIVAPDTACYGEKTKFYSNANGPFWWGTNSKATNILSTDSVYEFIADSSRWYYLFSSEGIDSMYLTVIQKPVINLGSDTSFCKGSSITLNATTTSNSIWFNLTNSPYYKANKEGYYWAVANNSGCQTIDSVFVKENPNPDYLPIHSAEICTADKQEYELQLSNQNKYLWIYDNDTSINKIFIKEGCHPLKITNEFGCFIKDSFCIIDICKPYIQVPNAFIPNGVNKTFKPITKYVEQIDWEVYNRYGEKIYSANKLTDEWDGTLNNNPCQSDVYFYIINYKGILPNNTNQTIKGTLTLIR